MNVLRQMTVNEEGRGDAVQHSHPNNGRVNFVSGSVSTTTRYILIDISDTTNYPHNLTSYIHIEDLDVQVDAASNADYEIKVGFIEDVDADNGNFYSIFNVSGTKQTGVNKDLFFPFYPNGPRMHTDYVATSDKTLNDTNYQTDVNLATTLDPSTADTPPGSNDIVVEIIINAQSISANINLSYHSH